MKAVVDTNVIAYLLVGSATHVDEVNAFWAQVTEPVAPAHWEAELVSVLWKVTRANGMKSDQAPGMLRAAGQLGIRSIDVRSLWTSALLNAISTNHSPYDVLFVELAQREQVCVATYDRAMLATWPAICRRPAEMLS